MPSKIKSALLLLIFFVSTITALPVFYTPYTSAQTTEPLPSHTRYESLSFMEQINSYVYYKTLVSCMKSADLANNSVLHGRHITTENLASNIWFSNTRTPTSIGVYAKTLLDAVDDSGKIQCGGDKGAQLISAALDLWLLDSATILCNSGFIRQNIGDNPSVQECLEATDESMIYGPSINNKQQAANALAKYIKSKIYGGAEPALTDAQKYIYYKNSLGQSCIPKIISEGPTDGRTGSDNEKGYNDVKWVNLDTEPFKIDTGFYIGTMKKSDQVITGMVYNGLNPTCQQVVNGMNSYAQAFLDWAKRHPDEAKVVNEYKGEIGTDPGNADDNENTCGAQVTGLGWIICPLIYGITKLNDGMWALVSGLLNVNPMKQSDPLYRAWGSVRSIANVLFVIFFLIIIFSQLTGMGITNYGVKKLLPKVIICAILVNISYVSIQGSLFFGVTNLQIEPLTSCRSIQRMFNSQSVYLGLFLGFAKRLVSSLADYGLRNPMCRVFLIGFMNQTSYIRRFVEPSTLNHIILAMDRLLLRDTCMFLLHSQLVQRLLSTTPKRTTRRIRWWRSRQILVCVVVRA